MVAAARDAAAQAWPAFVLVTGLLLVGHVAGEDGVFAWLGGRIGALGLPAPAQFVCALALIALVTALLNLDTAVVFLTPLLVELARVTGGDEAPYLYASVFMANASSLFLPGSNLTNLLVLAEERVPGGVYAGRILPAAVAAAGVTAIGLLVTYRRRISRSRPARGEPRRAPPRRPGVNGLVAAGVAATLTVVLPAPALPVLAVSVVAATIHMRAGRLRVRGLRDALSLRVTAGLFTLSVALGTLARTWSGPSDLIGSAGRWGTAGIGALGAVTLNNLPASVLLSADGVPHPRALLIGLNVGPNMAVTGSLSAFLWFQAARQVGASPSARTFSAVGVPLALVAMGASVLALGVVLPHRL
jgi:arsenical pump membrane protein